MPYNIFSAGTCRVDSTTTALACTTTNGIGAIPPEQFIPVRPDLSSAPIQPSQPVVWQSAQTGKFCRVVQQAGQSRLVCDQDSAKQATQLHYTGSGAWMGPALL